MSPEPFQPLMPQRRGPVAGRGNAALFGIDLGPARPVPAPPPEPEPDPLPALLDSARLDGFEAGRREGLREAVASAEAEAARALGEVARGLREGRAAAAAVADDAATRIARLALASIAAVLPAAAERMGEAEVMLFARALLPALAEEPALELRVAPALRPAIAARLAGMPRLEVQEDAGLRPGDAALRWRAGGSAERNAAAMQDAVLRVLAGLGLAELPATNQETGQ